MGLLVHNVAGIVMAPLLDQPLDDALRPVMVNCVNLIKFVRHYGQPMRERQRGGIVMFGSISGTAGGARLAAYSAASDTQTISLSLRAKTALPAKAGWDQTTLRAAVNPPPSWPVGSRRWARSISS